MIRVYLTGQRTFGNRGCEAIVRSTVAALKNAFGDLAVLVPSNDIQRDSRQWPEAAEWGVKFVPAYMPPHTRHWVHAQRLPILWLKRAGWPFPFPRWFRQQIASVDAVLSVGGDNYSLDYRLPSLLQGMDALAMDMGKPVILWGASVGPFEREPHFVPAIREHLARMDRIMVRESVSHKYLTDTLGLSNVTRIVDPAFTLIPQEVDCTSFWPQDDGDGVVGLNVSPLIERYKRAGQNLVDEVVAFIHAAVWNSGYGILLIPHVVPLDGTDKNNDVTYMLQILERTGDLGPRVKIASSDLNAAELKYVISQLRFFVGTRTHATIAALSSHVPTISIAYSIKARGINRDLFGNEDVVLATPSLSAGALARSLDYLNKHEGDIKQTLANRMLDYKQILKIATEEIKGQIHG